MPHDPQARDARIAELQAELAQIESDMVHGRPDLTYEELRYARSQTMRRIAQRQQDAEAEAHAAQQEAFRFKTPADGG